MTKSEKLLNTTATAMLVAAVRKNTSKTAAPPPEPSCSTRLLHQHTGLAGQRPPPLPTGGRGKRADVAATPVILFSLDTRNDRLCHSLVFKITADYWALVPELKFYERNFTYTKKKTSEK